MARNSRRFRCSAETVFRVLGDAWLYPGWVVGASRMRDVDEAWPEPGSRLRHSVGVWPLLLDDSTSVREWDPPRRMILRARGWPLGEATVTFTVEPDGEECLVHMHEVAVRGPGTLIPRWIADPVIRWRNRESLKRLAYLAEGGAR
ncbi:SRPBCC family protein [Leucobacter massiliensis]|uniref:Polyketide cyclase n=1 Tax=Leucobacter massiliensis TaxID=1686285 RepID=A0A2S9QKF6_9MICO|nr:SRPBCC family protein [Leucobacter massiliensis]PRI10070.1 polyketide cyclase [Leucobacter massiliensis]